eukprot:scaffold7843_cov61-Phaeocystis_antarctica.AAC.3
MPLVGRIVFLHVHVHEIGILPQVRDHVNSVEDVQAAPTQVAAQYYTASSTTQPVESYSPFGIMRNLCLSKPKPRLETHLTKRSAES